MVHEISTGSRTPSPLNPGPTAEQLAEKYGMVHQAETTIEAGIDSDCAGYNTDCVSRASKSMCSSVRDYAFEQGRRFQKFREGAYLHPNDESEQEREDMKHAMVVNLCGGKLHYAPIQNPQNIIDIGTGTGIWAIDVGDEYPTAQVLGIDLSHIQPRWVPPNVKFLVDDVESPWLYPPGCIDLVHIRHMSTSIKNWTQLLSQAYNHLKPGGWIELQDLLHMPFCDDGTMNDEYPVLKFVGHVAEALALFGIDAQATSRSVPYLRDVGFINVEQKVFKIPMGIWAKNRIMKILGLYLRSVLYDGLQAISIIAFTKGLGWSTEEIEDFFVDIRRSLMDHSIHAYFRYYIIYGQKPVEE